MKVTNVLKNITLTFQDGVGYMLCAKYCHKPLKLHLMPMPSFQWPPMKVPPLTTLIGYESTFMWSKDGK
jgi:hypothetical protein